MSVGIDLGPLRDAVEMMREKVPVGSAMGSAEWEAVSAEMRLRAMFSARVEDERILAEMQRRLEVRMELGKKDGRTMDRGVFIEEMREDLLRTGYSRGNAREGSLQDLRSTRRLGLIWDMNVAQAQGYARHKLEMTEDGLENEPCYELIRLEDREAEREWPAKWEREGGQFYDGPGSNDDYPAAPGRMIARKTDGIWVRISRFGVPWAPFDWGSGMGLRGIGREEADAFGITRGDERLVPPVVPPFNDGHRMSVRGLPEEAREGLRSDFGDAIQFDGDSVRLQREASPETYEQRRKEIGESLRERARKHYDDARGALERLRRGDDGAEVGFSGEGEGEIADIYLAQASAVAVGRKQLFHDTMTPAEVAAMFVATQVFPPGVGVHYEDGHFLLWRRDLLDLPVKAILQQLAAHQGGFLLGYGLDSRALNEPHVLVRIFKAPRRPGDLPVAGFHSRVEAWEVFAKARARDFEDAWGKQMTIEWEVRR
jgi:hypothetical protein